MVGGGGERWREGGGTYLSVINFNIRPYEFDI